MTLKANATATPRAPELEAANYPGRVVQVIDLGLQAQRPFEGQAKAPANEIMVTYELGTEFMPGEDGNPDLEKPRWISERFALFPLFSERAKSTKRYLVLDPTRKYDGDWAKMLGRECLVAVVNNVSKSNGKTYNNVGGIGSLVKGMVTPELVNPSKFFDLSNPDMEVFQSIPEWIQNIIIENLEYQGSLLQSMLEGKVAPPEAQGVAHDIDDVPF